MPFRWFIICLLLIARIQLLAQIPDENNFIHYTTKDGLSDNYISGLKQDSMGYIWIATYHGLNRFDGMLFKHMLYTGNPGSIPDNTIFSMELFQGNLLSIATDDGAQIISTKTLKQINLEVPTTDDLRYWSNACRYVSVDKDGNYGVSTKTGFYIFSPEGQLKKRWDHYSTKDIGRAWMLFGNHVYQLPEGNMMQQNSSGFLVYDRHRLAFYDLTDSYPSIRSLNDYLEKTGDLFIFISQFDLLVFNSANNSIDIIDIRNGNKRSFPSCFNLLQELGWQSRLSHISKDTWALNSKNKGFFLFQIDTVNRTVSCSQEKYFRDHYCTEIFSDNRERLWVGTTEGLFMENRLPLLIHSFAVENKGGADDFAITSLLLTNDRIFAGTDKEEILLIDKQTKKIIRRVSLKNLFEQPASILSFLKINNDTIWMATHSGLLWLHTSNYTLGRVFPGGPPRRTNGSSILFRDSRNNIWIGSNLINKIYVYNAAGKKLDSVDSKKYPLLNINVVNSIAEDNKGNIWLGGDAIARWNPGLQKIDTLIEHLPSQKNKKKGFTVMNDSNGDIWSTINDDGIVKITGAPHPIHIHPENVSENYAANVYPTLLQDRIFLATTSGIGIINTLNLKVTVFHTADGLPESPITTYRFIIDSSDHSAWFANGNSICQLPLQLNESYMTAPSILISELAIINSAVINYPTEMIYLKHFQNDINISLGAINFTDPKNMRFAYRFKNKKDTSWNNIGTQHNILLTNISPGKYQLEVKVFAYDNKWQKQKKELIIFIKPPFWRTKWFYAAIILLIAGAIYWLYKYRVNQINQKANLDKVLAQTEMKALHSQMNPHFIFNCLNSIKEMILTNENRRASHYLSKFAQLIRITLNQSSKSFINLRHTIDYLERYLEMEQIRSKHFTYSIDVDEALHLEDIFIPPMLIQPFIENAIWHGAPPESGPMHISIYFRLKGGELVCIIEDNGIGIDASLKQKEAKSTHNSMGIGNIRQRIQVLNEKYGLKSTLAIEDKSVSSTSPGTGTIVTLHLPIKNTEL